MQTEILTEARPLADEWWNLWRCDPDATPFQSPAWLLPWRRHFRDGENVVVTLRRHGRLVGLVPLVQLDGRLILWGAGTSDWLGGLFDPELEPEAAADALALLDKPLDLFQLAERAPLLRFPAPEGWEDRQGPSESCAVLSLPARPGTHMRQNLRYYARRAARGGVRAPERVGAGQVRSLAELHTRRWESREEPGVFADPRMISWLEEAAALLDQAGLLRLYAMRREGRVIAALCVLHAKGRAFYYIGGFDPEHAKLGLGTVLVGHAIAEAEREGLAQFDFLRGQEDYKYRWGAQDRPTYARYLVPAVRRAA
ncbi:GNAT family N-acetyltransferase [Chelativorans sp. AA-79]|uniref:GNAT family N-acetyltransferase n=1 Tax=Chelativorans sp. AA-79 TaxID=3028735 RepID=UPI0023F9F35E|nr:GNAT family N-acetyltransferase [Chelativorans sp. AA-79]WEX10408.1 GNAT family N-acetyltransferase [Chelativorans sp. AA-79]